MLEEAFSSFDTGAYFIIGAVGTALFTIRAVLMLAFGDDGGDFDVDAGGGMDVHDVGFSLLSLLSIMAFMMGFGWMGLLARTEWGFSPFFAAFLASAFGFSLLMLSSGGMYAMKRLQHSGGYDVRNALGKIGRVYLTIPRQGSGVGQVEVTVDGRKSVFNAVSPGEKLEAFTSVKVVEIREDGTLVVGPVT